MPRNTKKLTDLNEIISNQKQEIAKYKQLVNSIQGLIAINGIKINEDDYKELFYNDIGRDRKATTYNLSTEELAEALMIRIKKEGWRILTDGEDIQLLSKKMPDNVVDTTKETINYDDHMPSKEEIREKAEEAEEKTKKRKSKGKIPTNIQQVLEQERAKATDTTATASQSKTLEEHIKDLPPEAKARIQANNARARAAEKEKWHGEEGDREYERLTKKEKVETGELPATGDCPHCGEVLEAPIIRGYHDICWEAKNKKV